MLSRKLEKAIERAEANLSPVRVDAEHYIVGAFDYGDNTLSLMTTESRSVAEQHVHACKQLPDVHTVVVERPGVGMKVWIYTEYGRWRSREVRASDEMSESFGRSG